MTPTRSRRVGRMPAIFAVFMCLFVVSTLSVTQGDAARLPLAATYAVLESGPTTQSAADLSVFPVGQPRLRLTLDAYDLRDAVQDVKLAVGWVGSDLLAYATGSGQQIIAEPVYVQTVSSPKRVRIARAALEAAAAPTAARIAVLEARGNYGASGYPLALVVVDMLRNQTRSLPIPRSSTAAAVGFDDGQTAVRWSPDSSRIAAVWLSHGKLHLSICTIATDRCVNATHGKDVGLRSIPLASRIVLAWTSSRTIVIAVTPILYGHPDRSTVVTLVADRPGERPAPAFAPGTHPRQPYVGAISVAPTGGGVALAESVNSSGLKPLYLQTAHLRSGRIAPGPAFVQLSGQFGGSPAGVFSSTSSQAWSADGRFLNYSDQRTSTVGPSATVWQMDVAAGTRVPLVVGGEWVARQPSLPYVPLSRSAGSCPSPPPASSPPARPDVQQTMQFYFALREQAIRLGDSDCLAAVVGGGLLSGEVRQVAFAARAGQSVVQRVTAQVKNIGINASAKTATETAALTIAETTYQGSRITRSFPAVRVVRRYGLRWKETGRQGNIVLGHWMVVSLSTP